MKVQISASQVQDFLDCDRKWAWKKLVDGISPPPNKYARRGLAVHSSLEAWLRTGDFEQVERAARSFEEGPDPVDVAMVLDGVTAAVPHLPAPSDKLLVEDRFTWASPTFDDISYLGFIDLKYVDEDDGGVLVIHDHKTTSDLRWAKTADDLLKNVQAMLYAAAMMDIYGTDFVRLDWLYIQTKPDRPKAKMVRAYASYEDVRGPLEAIEEVARHLADLRHAHPRGLDPSPVLALPPNPRSCQSYGGCPFQEQCNLTETEVMRSYMANDALRQRVLAQLQKGKGTAVIDPNEVTKTEPTPAPTPAQDKPNPAPPVEPAAPTPSSTSGSKRKRKTKQKETQDVEVDTVTLLAAHALTGLLASPRGLNLEPAEAASEAVAFAEETAKALEGR